MEPGISSLKKKDIIKTIWFKLWLDITCSYTEHLKFDEDLIKMDYTKKKCIELSSQNILLSVKLNIFMPIVKVCIYD